MLQVTLNTLFDDRRLRPDARAFCPQTGANFVKSRRSSCYLLIIRLGDTEIIRQWPFGEQMTDEQVMAQAQQELDATTAPVAAIQLQKQLPGTVQKINNAIRRAENVYWEDENHVLHKILLCRRRQNQFQVRLTLDQHWHNADIKQVFREKQSSSQQHPTSDSENHAAATPA